MFNINKNIKSKIIRIIGNNIIKNKIIKTKEALYIAKKSNMDLIEINSKTNPPICKILDYGKFIYRKNKNIKKNKNKNFIIKEIKFRPNTNKNDYNIKIRKIKNLIKKKYKIKIIIRFKGREIIHKNIAIKMFNNIKKNLNKISKLDFLNNKIENNQMIMIFKPNK